MGIYFNDRSVERRMRDHMSRQMTYVVHSSANEIPPHLRSGELVAERETDYNNLHRDVFHAGTPAAADDARGGAALMHVYRIDRSAMDPVVWGDTSTSNNEAHLKNVPKPQLFETLPLLFKDIHSNVKSPNPKVQAYRNSAEDVGSTSFIIPKSLVGNGVEYLGHVRSR